MKDLITSSRPYVAIDTVTALANRIPGARRMMMRAAFRDGLLERRVHEMAPGAVEAGSAFSIAVAVLEKASEMNLQQIEHSVGKFAVVAAGLGGIYLTAKNFRKRSEDDAKTINGYMENELQAIHTVLSAPMKRESGAHVLGRCMRYLCYYLQRNLHVVKFENGMMDAVERRLSGHPETSPDYKRPSGFGLGRLKEAKDIANEDELLDDIIRGYTLLQQCEDRAFAEKLIRKHGPVGRYYKNCQRQRIDEQMHELGLDSLMGKLMLPKEPANTNQPQASLRGSPVTGPR